MKNLKGKGLLTILLVLALLVTSASSVFADFDKFLALGNDDKYYEYNAGELSESYIAYSLNPASPGAAMFAQLVAIGGPTKIVAYHDSVKGWMDGAETNTANVKAQLAGETFDINAYFASAAAVVYPETVTNPSIVNPDGTLTPTVDLAAYTTAVDQAEAVVAADYTAASYAALQTALTDNVVTDANTQVEIDAATAAINAAIDALVEVADMAAYDAAVAQAEAVVEADYTAASYAALQTALTDNVVTNQDSQADVDAATAAILDAQDDLVTVPVIAGMSATAEKQITITGTELSKLSASMISVAGNTVTKVEANTDGTSAVVTVGTTFVPETNTKVTATIDGTAKEYTVKYSVVAITAAIQSATFDDDKADQALTVLIDGVPTSVSTLTLHGYAVTFNAWDKNNVNANTTLFGASTTGGIFVPQATEADYTAQVTLVKGSSIVTSPKATIKIRDLDNNASEISAYKLTNTTVAPNFVMNSSSLVVNDTATISQITVGYGSAAAEKTSGYTVESADSSIISVNTTTNAMTAVGLGTTNITITFGTATKTIPVTVVGTKRVVTTATTASATMTAVKGVAGQAMTVTLKDQYGDPFVGTSTALKYSSTAVSGLVVGYPTTTAFTANALGEYDFTFTNNTATSGKTGVVVIRNNDDVVIGSFNFVTSDVNNVTSKKVAIDTTVANSSKDDVIDTDLASDLIITYQVNLFNSNGVQVGTETNLTGYKVAFNGKLVSVNGDATGSVTLGAVSRITVTGLKAGTTTMQVTDAVGNVIDTRTVTVLKGAPYLANITTKAASTVNYAPTTVDYRNVLDLTTMSSDDIVNGVTLSTASVYKVRIDEVGTVAGGAKGNLYLDKNDDGRFTAGETVLGTLTASQVPADSTTTWSAYSGNAIDGQSLVTGNKGRVSFVVTDIITVGNPVRATINVTVDVPKGDAETIKEQTATAAVVAWEAEVAAMDSDATVAAAKADTAGKKGAADTAVAALTAGTVKTELAARVTAATAKVTAADTLATAVTAFEGNTQGDDGEIKTSIDGIATIDTALATATAAGVPSAYLNCADVAGAIAAEKALITTAATVTTVTIAPATITGSGAGAVTATLSPVYANAAAVPLTTSLTGAYAVSNVSTVTAVTQIGVPASPLAIGDLTVTDNANRTVTLAKALGKTVDVGGKYTVTVVATQGSNSITQTVDVTTN